MRNGDIRFKWLFIYNFLVSCLLFCIKNYSCELRRALLHIKFTLYIKKNSIIMVSEVELMFW